MDIAIITIIVQLIFLECILSIDNAAVMGAMVANLPSEQPTPWPKSLRPLLGWADRFLGAQRDAALKVGLFGAYVLILFIGAKFLLELRMGLHIDDLTQFGISLAILALTIAFARVRVLQPLRIIFHPFIVISAVVQASVAFVGSGLTWPVRML